MQICIVPFNLFSDTAEVCLLFEVVNLKYRCALHFLMLCNFIGYLQFTFGINIKQSQAIFGALFLYIDDSCFVYNILIISSVDVINPPIITRFRTFIFLSHPLFIWDLASVTLLFGLEDKCLGVLSVQAKDSSWLGMNFENGSDSRLLDLVLDGNVFDAHFVVLPVINKFHSLIRSYCSFTLQNLFCL